MVQCWNISPDATQRLNWARNTGSHKLGSPDLLFLSLSNTWSKCIKSADPRSCLAISNAAWRLTRVPWWCIWCLRCLKYHCSSQGFTVLGCLSSIALRRIDRLAPARYLITGHCSDLQHLIVATSKIVVNLRGSCISKGEPRHNTLCVVSGEDKDPIEASFLLIATCNGRRSRT